MNSNAFQREATSKQALRFKAREVRKHRTKQPQCKKSSSYGKVEAGNVHTEN